MGGGRRRVDARLQVEGLEERAVQKIEGHCAHGIRHRVEHQELGLHLLGEAGKVEQDERELVFDGEEVVGSRHARVRHVFEAHDGRVAQLLCQAEARAAVGARAHVVGGERVPHEERGVR